MSKVDEKALDAATAAFRDEYDRAVNGPTASLAVYNGVRAAIAAYLSATPSEGGDVALREALTPEAYGRAAYAFDASDPDLGTYVRLQLAFAAALALPAAAGWQDISTCPKDGSHFLARQVVVSDEYDEDDRIIRRGVREEFTVVAYWVWGGVVQFPWNGGVPSNVTYILWQPLPVPPTSKTGGGPASTGAGDD